jgi:hypothetical protein
MRTEFYCFSGVLFDYVDGLVKVGRSHVSQKTRDMGHPHPGACASARSLRMTRATERNFPILRTGREGWRTRLR